MKAPLRVFAGSRPGFTHSIFLAVEPSGVHALDMKISNKPDSATVGARIRDLRIARKMSSTTLAAKAGVALPSLSALEHGALGLGPKRAQRLAAALGICTADLLRSTG